MCFLLPDSDDEPKRPTALELSQATWGQDAPMNDRGQRTQRKLDAARRQSRQINAAARRFARGLRRAAGRRRAR